MKKAVDVLLFIMIVVLIISFVGLGCSIFSYYNNNHQELFIITSILSDKSIVMGFVNQSSPKNELQEAYGKCGEQYNNTWIEPEPFEVADPLEGKELYIFYIAQICEQYYPDVDPYIAMAVMQCESNYNPNIMSKAGAVGLMQVIPKYHLRRAEKYGLNDIWDPYTNIICGIDLLSDLYYSYGSWERGLLGYNNSLSYVNWVLNTAETLRGGNYFGETASSDSRSS